MVVMSSTADAECEAVQLISNNKEIPSTKKKDVALLEFQNYARARSPEERREWWSTSGPITSLVDLVKLVRRMLPASESETAFALKNLVHHCYDQFKRFERILDPEVEWSEVLILFDFEFFSCDSWIRIVKLFDGCVTLVQLNLEHPIPTVSLLHSQRSSWSTNSSSSI